MEIFFTWSCGTITPDGKLWSRPAVDESYLLAFYKAKITGQAGAGVKLDQLPLVGYEFLQNQFR